MRGGRVHAVTCSHLLCPAAPLCCPVLNPLVLLASCPALSNPSCDLMKSIADVRTPTEELYDSSPCQLMAGPTSCGPRRVTAAFRIVKMDEDMLFPPRTEQSSCCLA